MGDPELATDPQTLELLHLRSRAGGGPGRQQAQRSSPGRPVGNALVYDADTPEAGNINDAILSRSGRTNAWDQSYG